jgi:hypothetical protein
MSGSGLNMSDHRIWNPAAKPDNAERLDNVERLDNAERPDMSSQSLWNLAAKSDKAERPNMSSLGGGYVRLESLKSG